jgi:hypothetical protein
MLTMIGTLISASSRAAFSRFKPTGAGNNAWITWFITLNPMNPQTMLGMAASSSINTFRVSFTRPVQNSETKMAAPRPNGMARSMARPVTLSVPMISAATP